jgi:predicted nucleic acid-binding protein
VSVSFAIDTNIAIYAFSKEKKCLKAIDLLKEGPKISIQVLNEFTSVSLRKRKLEWQEIEDSLDILTRLAVSMRPLGYDVHDLARMSAQRYRLSFYDALIVAAALLDQCETLYSEDMQHGLVIDGTLTIINPFLDAQELA